MPPELPRLADLGGRLLRVPRWRVAVSLLTPFALAAGYFALAGSGLWVPAVLAVAALHFATYGSVSHDLVHRSLGLPRRVNDTLLSLVELLLFRSGRAYQLAHPHHHARYPHADDVEGAAARGSLSGALLRGVVHAPRLWLWAVASRPSDRPRLLAEGTACAALVAAAVAAAVAWADPAPAVYVVLAYLGTWVYPLVTAYLPHTPAADGPLLQTRRFRGAVARLAALNHLYHLEHHLYPTVPHHNWPELARRLDPYLDRAGVPAVRVGP